jgi:hypothetical protein
VLSKVKVIQCAEDNDFMAAFDKMMADQIQVVNTKRRDKKCKKKKEKLKQISE